MGSNGTSMMSTVMLPKHLLSSQERKVKNSSLSNNKRVASRSTFYETLKRDALKLKNVCNDSVSITITKWKSDLDENEPSVTKYSIEPHFDQDHSRDHSPPPPSTPVPDRGRLQESSPSVRLQPTAKSFAIFHFSDLYAVGSSEWVG